jgi:hypothetical protein
VYDQLVEGIFELTGQWSGWRIRGDGKLIGPGGIKCSPTYLATLWKLHRKAAELELEKDLAAQSPQMTFMGF